MTLQKAMQVTREHMSHLLSNLSNITLSIILHHGTASQIGEYTDLNNVFYALCIYRHSVDVHGFYIKKTLLFVPNNLLRILI